MVRFDPHDPPIHIIRALPDLDQATHVASLGFRIKESEHLRQDVANHLNDGNVYTILEGRCSAGFAIVRRYPGNILYLCGIMLKPNFQGRGIARMVIDAARSDQDTYLALRTQSSIMWAAGRKICQCKWLPQKDDNDPELSEIGRGVACQIKTNYPVHHGFYGASLYGEKPIHANRKIQAWWDTICDYREGDAVVCVGRL